MVRKLWLIQPHEPRSALLPIDNAGGGTVHFSPAWDLICLHAFVLERTGHRCHIIDLRLHDQVEQAFEPWLPRDEAGDHIVALIYATPQNLESTGEIIRYLKRELKYCRIILFGPYPSTYPETLHLIPEVDFALCGDPEIKLRLLLDSLDVSHRLRTIAGLYVRGAEIKSPVWMPDLRNLSLPDWQQYSWRDYRISSGQRGARIEARLTRGQTGLTVDAAWPGRGEPLREWPVAQMAQRLMRCPGNGIDEVFLADPPGYWTDEKISAWCSTLRGLRNTQEWSFHVVARDLPDAILNELPVNGCHRVEIIIPTINPSRQRALGMDFSMAALKNLIMRMRQRSIDAQLVYWIEGPHAEPDEARAIFQHVRETGRPSFGVYPFPCLVDSPLVQASIASDRHGPGIQDWIAAAQDPDGHPAPDALWGGHSSIGTASETLRAVHRKIALDPARMLKRWFPLGGGGPISAHMGQQALLAVKSIASRTFSRKQ